MSRGSKRLAGARVRPQQGCVKQGGSRVELLAARATTSKSQRAIVAVGGLARPIHSILRCDGMDTHAVLPYHRPARAPRTAPGDKGRLLAPHPTSAAAQHKCGSVRAPLTTSGEGSQSQRHPAVAAMRDTPGAALVISGRRRAATAAAPAARTRPDKSLQWVRRHPHLTLSTWSGSMLTRSRMRLVASSIPPASPHPSVRSASANGVGGWGRRWCCACKGRALPKI